MATGNKVPWRDLLSELRDRDDRWEKLLCAKFKPLQDEVKEMGGQLNQICELSADNEGRIGELETAAEVAKAVRADCKEDKRARAELHLKRWHVWAIILGYVLLAGSAIVAAVI